MTIQECYSRMGGDYAQVLNRLPSEALVKRFITKFLEDRTYSELCQAMAGGDREGAFRAAHTLKGVTANLGMEQLRQSASNLTELLRPQTEVIPAGAETLLEQVSADYRLTVDTIRSFLG